MERSGFVSNFSNYPPGVTGNEPEIAGYPTVIYDKVEQNQLDNDAPVAV